MKSVAYFTIGFLMLTVLVIAVGLPFHFAVYLTLFAVAAVGLGAFSQGLRVARRNRHEEKRH